MTKHSKQKLLNAGRTFLRTRDYPDPANSGRTFYVIMECKAFGVWTTSGEKFETKIAREKRLNFLDRLEDAMVIIENE